jgi:hypothetical protein
LRQSLPVWLRLASPPASVSRVLELQTRTTIPILHLFIPVRSRSSEDGVAYRSPLDPSVDILNFRTQVFSAWLDVIFAGFHGYLKMKVGTLHLFYM